MKQLVYRKHGLMSNAKATFLLYVARYTMPCTIDLYLCSTLDTVSTALIVSDYYQYIVGDYGDSSRALNIPS